MKAQIRLGKAKGERLVIEGEAVIETLRASKSIGTYPDDEHCYWLYWTTGSGDLSVYLTDVECRELACKIAKTITMPEVGEKGGGMTKLTEAEKKSLDLWDGVVDALLKHMQHRRYRLLAALLDKDLTLGDISLRAIHRAATALAVFTHPADD